MNVIQVIKYKVYGENLDISRTIAICDSIEKARELTNDYIKEKGIKLNISSNPNRYNYEDSYGNVYAIVLKERAINTIL